MRPSNPANIVNEEEALSRVCLRILLFAESWQLRPLYRLPRSLVEVRVFFTVRRDRRTSFIAHTPLGESNQLRYL